MGMLTVQVWDATGNKRQDVEMPDDAPSTASLAVLLERMKFPQYAPDGQPLSYKFHHRPTGKQLLDDQTLADVGAKAATCCGSNPRSRREFEPRRSEAAKQRRGTNHPI